MEPREQALIAARAAADKKGVDIVVQDVSDLLKVTDFFVIVTGNSRPQIDAIVDEVKERMLAECGIKPIGFEGDDTCEWVLIDYGGIVVHVFRPEIRDFYRLETLWGDAPVIASGDDFS